MQMPKMLLIAPLLSFRNLEIRNVILIFGYIFGVSTILLMVLKEVSNLINNAVEL